MAGESKIEVPGHPFWNVFKRFGRDESIAMLVNILGTGILSLFSASAWALAVVGPVIEKIGFFPAHFWEAWKVWRTTPESKRKPLRHYFKKAVRGGGISLAEDVLIHDPIYILLMMVGMGVYPGAPAWLLAGASFVIAVFGVAGLELGCTELRYWLFKRHLFARDFELEEYYEARFLISAEKEPVEVLDRLCEEFGLDTEMELDFHDRYFQVDIPHYSGRTPKARLRDRGNEEMAAKGRPWGAKARSVQVIFTRAVERAPAKLGQYRYFPIRKDKIYHLLDGSCMPTRLREVKDDSVRAMLERMRKKDSYTEVRFRRKLAHNKDLLASVDRVRGDNPCWLLELKTHRNIRLLMKAMRFVMMEFPVMQTTDSKQELVCGEQDG
jgi:hypothetical protein